MKTPDRLRTPGIPQYESMNRTSGLRTVPSWCKSESKVDGQQTWNWMVLKVDVRVKIDFWVVQWSITLTRSRPFSREHPLLGRSYFMFIDLLLSTQFCIRIVWPGRTVSWFIRAPFTLDPGNKPAEQIFAQFLESTIPFSSMSLSYLHLSLYLSTSDMYGNTKDPQPTYYFIIKIFAKSNPWNQPTTLRKML